MLDFSNLSNHADNLIIKGKAVESNEKCKVLLYKVSCD